MNWKILKIVCFALISVRVFSFVEFEPFDEFPPEFVDSGFLPKQDNFPELHDFLQGFDEKNYEVVETELARFYVQKNAQLTFSEEIHSLLRRHVKEGSTVVDYGAETGVNAIFLSQLVGLSGKVIACEPRLSAFREMFWNMQLNRIDNVSLFYTPFLERGKTLDSMELKDVSLIKIGCNEELFLKGAEKTIAKNRPVLIVKLLGGIPIEKTDRYVKDIFDSRMAQLHSLGYTTLRINQGEYLALPR